MKNQDTIFSSQALLPMHLLSADTAVADVVGSHGYDITVGLMTRFKPHVIVCQLAHLYRDDFEQAAALFDNVGFSYPQSCFGVWRVFSGRSLF